MFRDTIAAISTAFGVGAISVIRLSGDQSIDIINRIFSKNLSQAKGYTVHYGTIHDQGKAIDEVLVTVFRAPKSYTGEDSVEISCHGGIYITREVLRVVLGAGARLARRGEFTERAFLNGHLDLAQAEGVNDLIHAQDELNASSAFHSLKGSVKKLLEPLVDEIVQIISHIEVNIDYPEYDDVQQLTELDILPRARKWMTDLDLLIARARQAAKIRYGIQTVILGKPNVGKSSLLNALLEEDKAIVTDIAGTTRDLVEGTVHLNQLTLNLIDTAGIRKASDAVEKIGIEKSLQALKQADLVILVIDGERGIDDEDRELLACTEGYNRIIVYNKKDQKQVPGKISISALNHDIHELTDAIEKMYENECLTAHSDTLNNERQIGLAIQARNEMEKVVTALEAGIELDLVTIDLQNAYHALKEITGEYARENLLDEIFSRFCLGK